MKIAAPIAIAALMPALALAGEVKVEHLGTNNTLVRVSPEAGELLLMPVQESNDDARINVLVDGKLDRTMYVRLAKSKVDYSVPFDLTPYKGHDVVLDIVTEQNRSSVREAKDDVCWRNFTVSDTFDTTNREKYRPAYHHTPAYGWMNDPNGMFYADGVWHLYYQYNPFGSKWQNMTWGHSTSTDLVHWKHEPIAIEPDGIGTIFSGSAAIDSTGSAGFGKNAVVAMYTSASRSQMQSLAASNDGGMSFTKFNGNPVLTLESEARDPNFFFDPATGEWKLVLAHALDHEMLFFTSPDLKTWTLTGSFGKGIGAQDGVWECPDLFRLPVDGTGTQKWVLLCNINPGGPFGGSATQYFIGEFDGKTFRADTLADGTIPTKWLDYGKDHYATVTWSDAPEGRRTAIGWMSNWQYAAEVPTMQYRSANTLPREISLFTAPDGQIYAASEPSPELLALRGKAVAKASGFSAGKSARDFAMPANGLCEIESTLTPAKDAVITFTLSNSKGNKVSISYNQSDDKLAVDRTASGESSFIEEFPAVTAGPAFTAGKELSLRVFVDRSSIEVFANGGRLVLTNIVFPEEPYTTLSVSSTVKSKINSLKVYDINI